MFISKFGMGHMYSFVISLCGGYDIYSIWYICLPVCWGCGLDFLYVVLCYLQVINSCFKCVYLGGCATTVVLVVNA